MPSPLKSVPGAAQPKPNVRKTLDTTGDVVRPGCADSATIRSFSSRLQRRRRSTDVITSTGRIVLYLLSQ